MSDAFIFRLMLVIIAVVIMFALVIQYNRNKSSSSSEIIHGSEQFADSPVTSSVRPNHEDRDDRWQRVDAPAPAASSSSNSSSSSSGKAPAAAKANAQPDRLSVAPPPKPALSALNHQAQPFNKAIDPAPFESLDTEMYRTMDYKPEANKIPQPDPFPKDRLTKDDLLPKDAANTKWAQVNPAGQGDLENVNLLDAGWNYGIDTQGQTLKNPNLQIRSEFPNPRADTGPWNKSTIETDCSRRYFEIGEP